MSESKKCAHPSCNCIPKEGKSYCSTYCEGQAETADIECSCGHGGCAAAVEISER
jgi:hypothetical protein